MKKVILFLAFGVTLNAAWATEESKDAVNELEAAGMLKGYLVTYEMLLARCEKEGVEQEALSQQLAEWKKQEQQAFEAADKVLVQEGSLSLDEYNALIKKQVGELFPSEIGTQLDEAKKDKLNEDNDLVKSVCTDMFSSLKKEDVRKEMPKVFEFLDVAKVKAVK